MSAQHTTTDPSFPTQSELRQLVADVQRNTLSRQLFFDASRFRAIIDLDGVVVALNDFAVTQRGADVDLILDRPFWEDPIFNGDPLWEGRMRSRFAEALTSPNDTIEYEDRIDIEDEAPLLLRVRIAVVRNHEDVPIGFLLDSQDVGREHRSRALVREQQRLLHVVFERTFQLVAILDPTGRIIDVNDAISRIGLTREVAVGRTIQELGASESEERAAEWQARVDAMQTATEPRRYFDVRELGAEQTIATDVSMTPVRNDDGTLDLILLEFRDQTERHEAEERLRDSEERLRLLVEALPQMVWATTADGRLDYLSPSWQEFTGRTLKELVEDDWEDMVHPDDYHLLTSGFGDAPVIDIEFRMKNRDGDWRWMHSRARSVVDAAGNVRRWYGATTDVTERREAEELRRSQAQQIEAAAELSGMGSFVWDLPSNTLATDERYERIMGFNEEELGDDKWAGFIERVHPDDRDRVAQAVGRVVDGSEARYHEEYRMLVDDGSGVEERWVVCSASVEHDEQGQPVRMYGALEDITIARREDEARVRLQKVEAIGTLVGAIAHDFNNVIGAVLTYARVAEAEMQAGELPEESVAEIARGARRAADILGRLMAFGREETPRRIRFDVAEVVEEAVALVRPTLKGKASVDVSLPGDLPPLDGDPTQIHQVMVNLLTNAGQALENEPSGLITVRASVVDLDGTVADGTGLGTGRYIRITVHDNGPGFPPGIAHRLFDPFFTTKPAGKGTGLGLSAVQSIVRAHRGAVSAIEPPTGGAMFSVLLPVVEDAASPGVAPSSLPDVIVPGMTREPSTREAADGAEPVAPPAPRRRINALFVDDEPALVRLAGRAMPYRDIDVSGHVDAAEALELFKAQPEDFDVLVTDLSMPTMSGFELIDQIRAVRPGFPVVLTSGYLGPADEQAAIDRAIDAVLPKPCSIEDIAAAVRRITS
ncbi:MAG: PAS domain S-box protein [Solirubrobacteraceae bacterium]|nr:PAS domain S-box protein [Solirubrobacteraceae bacterium]